MDRIDISGTYISAEAIGATDISVDIQSVNTRLKTNITSFWKSDLYGIVNYLIKIDNYAPVSKYHTSVIDNTNQLSAGIGLYSNYGKHFYTDLALFVDLLEYAPSDTSLPRFYV